jgi:hypothetical protein
MSSSNKSYSRSQSPFAMTVDHDVSRADKVCFPNLDICFLSDVYLQLPPLLTFIHPKAGWWKEASAPPKPELTLACDKYACPLIR